MKYRWIVIVFSMGLTVHLCGCQKKTGVPVTDQFSEAYDVDQDVNDPQHTVPLSYEQAQGKRIYYDKCIWCHADATPAGPSNRNNLKPQPPLLNDGNVMNALSDAFIRNIVTLGGSAIGKSPMMPPWGNTLSEGDIRDITAYVRAVAQPPYQPTTRALSDYGAQ